MDFQYLLYTGEDFRTCKNENCGRCPVWAPPESPQGCHFKSLLPFGNRAILILQWCKITVLFIF